MLKSFSWSRLLHFFCKQPWVLALLPCVIAFLVQITNLADELINPTQVMVMVMVLVMVIPTHPDRGEHPPAQPFSAEHFPGGLQALHPARVQPDCYMGGRIW